MKNLILYKEIRKELFENKYSGWEMECSLIDSAIEGIEWNNLSSEEKNMKRIASFSLGRKWDSIINPRTKSLTLNYPESLVKTYAQINSLLSKIELSEKSVLILRVKVLLTIEKSFYNDALIPTRHVPIDMFNNLLNDLRKSNIYNEYLDFVDSYSIMFNYWNKMSRR